MLLMILPSKKMGFPHIFPIQNTFVIPKNKIQISDGTYHRLLCIMRFCKPAHEKGLGWQKIGKQMQESNP